MLFADPAGVVRNLQDVLSLSNRMAASYAHELRNPLQTIQGAVAMLRLRGGGTDDLLDTIDRSVVEISDILGERLVPGRGAEPAPVCTLSAIADRAIADAMVRRSTRHVSFDHELRPDEPSVRAHGVTMRRVFANLFRNTAQARPDARVRIRYAWDEAHLACVVEDDGPGLAEGALNPAADPEGHQEHLGLMLVSAALELQHGTVRIENAEGGGVRVTLRLPLAEPVAADSPPCRRPAEPATP